MTGGLDFGWLGEAIDPLARGAATTMGLIVVRVGIGIGPMIAATIPEGCSVLDRSRDLPAPIRIDIGFYARTGVSEEARHLVDFVSRHSVLTRP